MRAIDRNAFKWHAERRFPHRFDMRVPDYGEPWPFAEMLEWGRGKVAAGGWAQHSFMNKLARRSDAASHTGLRRAVAV